MEGLLIILIIAAGTYGVATLLTAYDGPLDLFKRLRSNTKSGVLSCAMCTGFWVSALIALLLWSDPFLWLAGYGVFALVEHE